MKLSTRSRYGTRLMLDLALHFGKGPVQLKDIAKSQNISEKYLGQIIIPLKSKGLVQSERGAHGGYYLAYPPDRITVKDIVVCLEGDIAPVECVNDRSNCDITAACVTKNVWAKLTRSIDKVLSSISLESLVNDLRHSNNSYNYVI